MEVEFRPDWGRRGERGESSVDAWTERDEKDRQDSRRASSADKVAEKLEGVGETKCSAEVGDTQILQGMVRVSEGLAATCHAMPS